MIATLPFRAASADEPPVHDLPEYEVRANATTRRTPLRPSESLAELPRLHLRAQGIRHGQSDLRIRGSAFSGAGLAIAGVPLRIPQTEHFHAELPISPRFLTSFRVATGTEQTLRTEGHLVGAAVADFAPVRDGGTTALHVGEQGGLGGTVFLEDTDIADDWGLQVQLASRKFAGQDYGENEVSRHGGALHLQRREDAGTLDLALGFQRSDFGARGFYGVSPQAFPFAHEELEDLLLAAVWTGADHTSGGGLRVASTLRRLGDEYLLNEHDPAFYQNEHVSTVSALTIERSPELGPGAAILARLTLEDERIDGTGMLLGTPNEGLGTHSRQRLNLTLLPCYQHGRWELRVGGKGVAFTSAPPEVLGIGAVAYDMSDRHRASISVAQTVREPSYTELNYESPASLGNEGLENQTATETELRWDAAWTGATRTTLAAYHRVSQNTVDWVRPAPGTRWQATDMGTVTASGLEFRAAYSAQHVGARLAYALLAKDAETPHHASRYALDYARHRVTASAEIELTPSCDLKTVQEWTRMADNPARSSGASGFLGRIEARYRPRFAPLAITVGIFNVWDTDLQRIPGQKPAGRWVHAGAVYHW